MLHLINNPKAQHKMQEELDTICGEALPTLVDKPEYRHKPINLILFIEYRCMNLILLNF